MATLRAAGEIALTTLPPIRISPSSGVSRPRMRRRIVDLPDSGGPKKQKNSLSSIVNEASLQRDGVAEALGDIAEGDLGHRFTPP